MAGFICKREVIGNAGLIIKLYGFRKFCKCLVARKNTTFLSIVISGWTMFLVVMLSSGTLVTINNAGMWVPIRWDLTGGPVTTDIAAVPQNAVIMDDMLPNDTIDAYLADVTTGLPIVEITN